MNTRTHHCWSWKSGKNNYSPNDWFLIKFLIKIISLDSSQRVPYPPMSPCPPLIITRGFPLLINPFQGGVYLGGKLGKTIQGPSDLVGGVINPVLPLLYIYIYLHQLPRHDSVDGVNGVTGSVGRAAARSSTRTARTKLVFIGPGEVGHGGPSTLSTGWMGDLALERPPSYDSYDHWEGNIYIYTVHVYINKYEEYIYIYIIMYKGIFFA